MVNHRKILGIKGVSIFTFVNALLFFLISFRAPGVSKVALTYAAPPIVGAVQSLSLYVCLVLLAVSALLYFAVGNKTLSKSVNAAFLSFVIFHTILIVTDFYVSGNLLDFLVHLVFILTIYLYFGFIVKDFFLNKLYVRDYIFSIYYGIFAFVLVNFVLEVGDLGNLTWKGRFHGVTAQPNFIGVCCGLCTVFSLSLLASKKELSKFQKALLFSGAAMGGYLCLASGSRSAMLAIVVSGLLLAFYGLKSDFSRYLIVLLGVCLGVFVLFNYEMFTDTSSIDYTSRGNTREETWKELYDKAMTLPIFGFGSTSSATTNSYLFAIVATGLLGGFFFFRTLYLFFLESFKTMKRLINVKYLTYPLISLSVYLLVVAMFEGFMLDSASIPVFSFWFLLSLK